MVELLRKLENVVGYIPGTDQEVGGSIWCGKDPRRAKELEEAQK